MIDKIAILPIFLEKDCLDVRILVSNSLTSIIIHIETLEKIVIFCIEFKERHEISFMPL